MNIFQKIKVLFTINSIIKNIKEGTMKSGWKTSEFWFTILGQIIPIVITLWGFIPQTVMLKIMAISGILSAVYILARSLVKITKSKVDDAVFNKLNVIIKVLLEKLNIKVEDLPL
jgi:hypothetical protein